MESQIRQDRARLGVSFPDLLISHALNWTIVTENRILFFLYIKPKKHFVGLTWADGDKKGGLAMQCDKNEYRGILAGLEGVLGKKAVGSTRSPSC